MLDFQKYSASTGGTGGLVSFAPFLGVHSPMLKIAYTADEQLGGLDNRVERDCARRNNPILSGEELVDVEDLAIPADVAVLHRVKITR